MEQSPSQDYVGSKMPPTGKKKKKGRSTNKHAGGQREGPHNAIASQKNIKSLEDEINQRERNLEQQRKEAFTQDNMSPALIGNYEPRPQTHQLDRRAVTGDISAAEGSNLDYGLSQATDHHGLPNSNLRSIEHLSTQ